MMRLTRTSKIFKGTKRPGELHILVFGDVHLGNSRNSANEMIVGLMSFFKDPDFVSNLDAIFIEGDLFDTGLSYNYDRLPVIQTWMCWLLTKCVKHNIILRVLEGTPSHDNKQSKNFLTLIETMGIKDKIDFLYADNMIIEEHPIIGSILYVPDEWSTSCEFTYESAKKLILSYGKEQVDFILMHGAFDHQLPMPPVHNGALWQELVQYAILVGHVHTHSISGKIIAAGSTDRCEHGNEEPKGALHIVVSERGLDINFIENIHAKKFVTVDCRGLSVEETLNKLKEYSTFPPNSYIRLYVRKTDNASNAIQFLSADYPDFYWDRKLERDDAEIVNVGNALPEVQMQPVSITKENITEILLDYANKKFQNDPRVPSNMLEDIRNKIGEICQEL